MGIELRAARAEDAEAVADLWHRGWHDAHAGHVPAGLTAGRTRAEFGPRAADRMPSTTLALRESALAGFVTVVDDEVEQLFVAAAHRGTGVADRLLAHGTDVVAAAGYAEAWLAVVSGNARARRFYERHGWADRGDLPYEVVSAGTTYLSPCRRYVTDVDRAARA